jgi:hypothetical protein
MSKSSMLRIVVILPVLAGCASPSGQPASNMMAANSADCGFHFRGGSGLLGLRGAAGAFERPAGPDCRQPASTASRVPLMLQEEESGQSSGTVETPNFAAGQTVYSPHESIGAVVNGECHGSILADYRRPHPTCYGQMINGICTGAMFEAAVVGQLAAEERA